MISTSISLLFPKARTERSQRKYPMPVKDLVFCSFAFLSYQGSTYFSTKNLLLLWVIKFICLSLNSGEAEVQLYFPRSPSVHSWAFLHSSVSLNTVTNQHCLFPIFSCFFLSPNCPELKYAAAI